MRRGDRATVFYLHGYLTKRWLLILVPLIVGEDSALQVICLLNINKFGVILYGAIRPHELKSRRQLEFFNESMIMLISYAILAMTPFNLSNYQIYIQGYVFIAWFTVLVLGNVVY